MMPHVNSDSPSIHSSPAIVCRRCRQPYAPPDRKIAFPSCPHCGAAARPLWRTLHDNRHAAVLAFLAILVLTGGILTPFMSIQQINVTKTFSLLGGIRELFDRGNKFLGGILLIFSVVFPYAKLAAILVATSRLVNLSDRARRRLHDIAVFTGRYSLLDILVVAIMIVVIKFDGLVEVKALPGTILFAIAVFLSIIAGFCVNLTSARTPPHD
jgi:paraquat-inducible protein A